MNQEYDLRTWKYLNESNANDENIKANPKRENAKSEIALILSSVKHKLQ